MNVLVPQMGEGLQEVIVISFHKQPGDHVKRDEPLYSMETDKALMDVESPFEGRLVEWMASEGDVLPIGAIVARIEAASDTPTVTPEPPVSTPAVAMSETTPADVRPDLIIPPRTRAYCKEHSISDDEMRVIPCATGKLMPADVDAYLQAKSSQTVTAADIMPETPAMEANTQASVPTATGSHTYTLTGQQRVLTSRIRRSGSLAIPASMTRPLPWSAVSECVRKKRDEDFTFRPTEFQSLAWCVAQATKLHPKFRSVMLGDDQVREYAALNLGIAVALKSGDLVTAVVRHADTLDYAEFIVQAQAAISQAREGKDQAEADTQLHLTYMGGFEITEATPVLVSPAIAVLFIGAGYPRDGETFVNLSLTFDHRLINGVEGALFLKSVAEISSGLPTSV